MFPNVLGDLFECVLSYRCFENHVLCGLREIHRVSFKIEHQAHPYTPSISMAHALNIAITGKRSLRLAYRTINNSLDRIHNYPLINH